MPKFRKRPVVIEAEQFNLSARPYPAGVVPIVVSADDDDLVLGEYTGTDADPEGNCAFGIRTLEGWYVVRHGDWVITGIKGERYPCRSDIFEATYEAVDA